MRKLLSILVLLVPSAAGCLAEGDELATRTSELEACPDSVADGAACRVEGDRGLACEREGDVLCTCDRAAGVWHCEEVAPPPPDACPDSLHEGDPCERIGASCTRTCDEPETCRCVGGEGMREDGTEDPADTERAIWICEGEPPPPPPGEGECTDEWFARCEGGDPTDPMGTEGRRCVSADGTSCWCEIGDEGRGIAHCEGDPPPPPPDGTCTDEFYAACEAGMTDPGVPPEGDRCISPDGSVCWCERTEDGGRGGVVCEGGMPGPVPGADECTEEHFAACEAGREVECARGDVRCRCELTREGRGLLVCG